MRQVQTSVFPVFRYGTVDGTRQRSREGDYLGTGFFVERGSDVIFVTARHCVDIEPGDWFVGVGDLLDHSKHDFGEFEYHATADLAIAVFSREKAPTFAAPMPLGPEHLEIGDQVGSYGFPLSGEKRIEGARNLVRIEQMVFRGHVITDWGGEDLAGIVRRPFGVNYGLSFACPRGLSGAPLLAFDGAGRASVAGLVYGNRTIEFQVRAYEEVARDGAVERTVEFDAHHFGLASDLAELLSMLD